MSQVLQLQMPGDAAYHALAAEAAGRICALAGGDSTDAKVFGAELTAAREPRGRRRVGRARVRSTSGIRFV